MRFGGIRERCGKIGTKFLLTLQHRRYFIPVSSLSLFLKSIEKLIDYGAIQRPMSPLNNASVCQMHKAIRNFRLRTFLICAWESNQQQIHEMTYIKKKKQCYVPKYFVLKSSIILSYNSFLVGSITSVSILFNVSQN